MVCRRTDERSFRMKDFCIDLLQSISAQIVVPVARRSPEAGLTDPAGLHCVNDLQLVIFGSFVDPVKSFPESAAYVFSERKNIRVNAAGCIKCTQFFSYQFGLE